MNWEALIVPSIPGVLALIGVVYGVYASRRNNQEDNDSTKQARREPTWNEVVNENRQLRKDLDEQKKDHEDAIRKLEERFDAFEKKTNTRIGGLSNMLHEASRQWPSDREGPYFDQEYLDALENTDVPYIWRNRVRPGGVG